MLAFTCRCRSCRANALVEKGSAEDDGQAAANKKAPRAKKTKATAEENVKAERDEDDLVWAGGMVLDLQHAARGRWRRGAGSVRAALERPQ